MMLNDEELVKFSVGALFLCRISLVLVFKHFQLPGARAFELL